MIPNRIDAIAHLFARRRSASIPATPMPDTEHGPEMLFVQSFQSGSIVPRDDVEGRYTVTLEQGLGETIYFSDRPDRIVGSTPTAAFLDGLGFIEENPPNAAILTSNADGDTTLAVVELFAPVYDEATHSVTYDLAILDHWQDDVDLGFGETPVDLDALGETFGTTHLFIDDCPPYLMYCINNDTQALVATIPNSDHDGWCYSWVAARCLPCQPWYQNATDVYDHWNNVCNMRHPACDDNCLAGNAFWAL